MPFSPITELIQEYLITAAWGKAKDGKTSFALSWPDPIYLLNFDFGYRELLPLYPNKKIEAADYILPDEYSYKEYNAIKKMFMADWRVAINLAHGNGGTVVLDTGDTAWDVVRLVELEDAKNERIAKFGDKADRDDRRDYGKPNLTFENLLKRPHQYQCNAVFIQRAGVTFQNGEATKDTYMHGFNATANVAQVVLNIYAQQKNVVGKDGKPIVDNGRVKTTSEIWGRIDACRFPGGLGVRGDTILNPTYDGLKAALP